MSIQLSLKRIARNGRRIIIMGYYRPINIENFKGDIPLFDPTIKRDFWNIANSANSGFEIFANFSTGIGGENILIKDRFETVESALFAINSAIRLINKLKRGK